MGKPFPNSSANGATAELTDRDPGFSAEIERLYQVTVCSRWLAVIGLWLTVGSLSLWGMRSSISLWLEYFTWAAFRYGLAYHRWATMGLALCVGSTVAVLAWHSRNRFFGLPAKERDRLAQRVLRIRHQGGTHPLWSWVCRKEEMGQTMGDR